MLNHASHWNYFHMSLFLIQFVSSAPLHHPPFSTSPSRSSSFHFFWTASPPSTFSLLTEKKNFRQTSKIHLSGLTFFEMPCDGYPWAPAILQKPIWSYWSIRKDSLIDFHVMLKGAELLFFRLKILFNWKIIVVEETETFLSPGN